MDHTVKQRSLSFRSGQVVQSVQQSSERLPGGMLPGGILRSLLILSFIATLTGCAFEREWQAAQTYAYPQDELAGCWEGSWQSDYNGHNGALRAIITKQGDGYYNARFHATYAVLIPFEFELPMLVTDEGRAYTFEGQADLGWLAGGVYTYDGHATPTEFFANYCAENNDHGTFTMTKVPVCGGCRDGCGACLGGPRCGGACQGTCGDCGPPADLSGSADGASIPSNE